VTKWFGFVRLMYCVVTLAIIMVAVVLDVQVAHYFGETIDLCEFPSGHIRCYCSGSKTDFEYIFNGVGEVQCNNVATRHPSILDVNAAFSVGCFLVSCLTFISLISGFLSVRLADALDYEQSLYQGSNSTAQSRLHEDGERV
jgi:hypothetical protein